MTLQRKLPLIWKEDFLRQSSTLPGPGSNAHSDRPKILGHFNARRESAYTEIRQIRATMVYCVGKIDETPNGRDGLTTCILDR